MGEINWSLLGAPVNVGAAVNAGFERGREMRLRGQQESAFALLARDPMSREGLALLTASGRPDTARQMRQWGLEDSRRARAAALLGGGQPSAFAGSSPAAPVPAGPSAPTASAFATPAPSVGPAAPIPAATPPAASPSAPVAATAAPQLDQAAMQAWYREDPEGAREFQTQWTSFNDAQRAAATQRFVAAQPVLGELMNMGYQQRRAFIQQQAPALLNAGWSQQELAAFDPTDANVRTMLRYAVPVANQRAYFAPQEGGAGAVYRNPETLDVIAANPAQPRTEQAFDEQGNQFFRSVPGTPAIGPGADLFGSGAAAPSLTQGELPTVATPQEAAQLPPGTRFRDPEGNIRTVPGGPTPQASGNFP